MIQTLFEMSINKCQKLIDTMLEYQNKDGICVVSQVELAKRLSLCQTNISDAIKKINTEDLCIEQLSPGFYKIHYTSLLERGTFSCIFRLMLDLRENPNLAFEKDKSIANRYRYKLKTVQMFKAYIKSGWKKYTDELLKK